MKGSGFFLGAILCARVLAAPAEQAPLVPTSELHDDQDSLATLTKKRPLHGRFLHITDFHPDRFYKVYSSTGEDAACHRGDGPAGIYGAETSECDSPFELVNKTMAWVRKELRDNVDFVIWTGDSARHDNDENIPRNVDQVTGLNQFMVDKMFEAFGKDNGDEEDDDPNNDYVVPVIPNFGNNDVLPHNIFRKGPNKWTRTYAKMWKRFIPEAQKHQFEQGGWFCVEVIPSKLAVFSINTLYFFTSNSATDGCAAPSEPGYQQLEWMRIQLQFMRDRGMKAILTGHVPPIRTDTKTNWEETCWQKYTLWLQQYRDVIVSSHYGHFNYDHFILQDFDDINKDTRKGRMGQLVTAKAQADGDVHARVSPDYWIELRQAWSQLPKVRPSLGTYQKLVDFLSGSSRRHEDEQMELANFRDEMRGDFAERFSTSFCAASVVPNLLPSFRIFEYNVTGLDGHDFPMAAVDMEELSEGVEVAKKHKKKKGKKGKKKQQHKYKFEVPDGPSKSAPPGPAYSPQPLSLIKYTQYLANLTYINNDFQHSDSHDASFESMKWRPGKHHGKKPHKGGEKPKPNDFEFQIDYDTMDDEYYQLQDLTMPSMVDLARRIGDCASDPDEIEAVEIEEIEVNDTDDEADQDDTDIDVELKKKKHKKKHGKKHHARKHCKGKGQNEAWLAFVRRAFVETLTDEELMERFGD